MSNIPISPGMTYRFARSQGNTIILDSTDHSHAIKTFGNGVVISGSSVPNACLDITVNANGFSRIQKKDTGTTTPMFQLSHALPTGHVALKFDGTADYTMGVYNNSTSTLRDFQISNASTLQTSPRTDTDTCIAFSPACEPFIPNLDAATGTNYVKWNSSTREITYQSSTQKIKKNITSPSSSIYNSILSLQPRYFQMKNPKDNDTQFLGFIAEEVASVSPSLATYGADYNFDESGSRVDLASNNSVPIDIDERAIIASLVGKIQDLEQRIQQLESQ